MNEADLLSSTTDIYQHVRATLGSIESDILHINEIHVALRFCSLRIFSESRSPISLPDFLIIGPYGQVLVSINEREGSERNAL